jgi:hypothetical protein
MMFPGSWSAVRATLYRAAAQRRAACVRSPAAPDLSVNGLADDVGSSDVTTRSGRRAGSGSDHEEGTKAEFGIEVAEVRERFVRTIANPTK